MTTRCIAAALFVAAVAVSAPAQDLNAQNEAAIKAAVARVAASVVKIETAGGAEVIGSGRAGVRKGVGPTTGLVVAADGYVITSAFNFANKPSSVFVSIPGKPRLPATIVATDQTRFLTLVKVNATGLPVPVAAPAKDLRIGDWSIAVGRGLSQDDGSPPSVSVGIVSALGRMWGKAIQTDAKVSPVNYGGPLMDIQGRVQGILVPGSSRGEGETAGVEWYDSGIGFAIPLEDVFAVLPRLREGKELRKGLLGINPKGDNAYTLPATIGTVAPDSAAEKAGIKPGDTITELAGTPISNFSQVQHVLGPRYEGDEVKVVVTRDGKSMTFPNVRLTGAVTAFAAAFLGLLPMRDDPDPGVGVRYVFPNTSAATAGIKPGDRVLKVGMMSRPNGPPAPMIAFSGRTAIANFLAPLPPGQDVRLEVKRKDGGKVETLTLKTTAVTDALPDTLPPESSAGRAMEKPKTPAGPPAKKDNKDAPPEPKKDEKAELKETETGLLQRQNATLGREYWVYVPPNYKPEVSHGVIVWLHPARQGGAKDAERMTDIWKQFCADQHYILFGPKSQSADGWVASETESIVQDVKDVMASYTVDRSRVIAHGMGVGGQMAYYLGFNARDLFRGVAVTGAVLGTQPKDNLAAQPLSFFIVGGEKDPAFKEIAEAKAALADKKFPVVYRPIPEFGKEYMDQKTLIEMCIWLDSLDKF